MPRKAPRNQSDACAVCRVSSRSRMGASCRLRGHLKGQVPGGQVCPRLCARKARFWLLPFPRTPGQLLPLHHVALDIIQQIRPSQAPFRASWTLGLWEITLSRSGKATGVPSIVAGLCPLQASILPACACARILLSDYRNHTLLSMCRSISVSTQICVCYVNMHGCSCIFAYISNCCVPDKLALYVIP